MADTFNIACACGARLRVPSALAGKKAKCPKCAAVVLVPGFELDRPEPPKPPPPKAPPPPRRTASRPRPAASACPACGEPDGLKPGPAGALLCVFCGTEAGAAAAAPGPVRVRDDGPAALVNRRHLMHEAHIQAIGLWSIIGGALVLLCAGLMMIGGAAALANARRHGADVAAVMGIVVVVCVVVGGLGIALGIFLRAFHGWARITYAVLTILGTLIQLAGMAMNPEPMNLLTSLMQIAWNGACLWAVLGGPSGRIFTPEYRDIVARTKGLATVPILKSPFLWVPMALCVGVFCLAFMGGFLAGAMRR